MHTCTGNLNISPGFESFEILRIPNFSPTVKIYVGGKLDCYIGKLKTTASSNNSVNLAREIIEKIPGGYPMFVCYVETSSNNIFSYGYMYHSKKYGVIHIDSYFSCQAVALINGEYKLIA